MFLLVKIWLLSIRNISPWCFLNSKSFPCLRRFLESSFVFLFISSFKTWIMTSVGQYHTKQVKKQLKSYYLQHITKSYYIIIKSTERNPLQFAVNKLLIKLLHQNFVRFWQESFGNFWEISQSLKILKIVKWHNVIAFYKGTLFFLFFKVDVILDCFSFIKLIWKYFLWLLQRPEKLVLYFTAGNISSNTSAKQKYCTNFNYLHYFCDSL